jgi:16S rRNA (cytidine1402-2'-O)-methyltransferase
MQASRRILGLLKDGISVGLCSNAGTPTISDPGFRATQIAIENGYAVLSIPGPCAVTSSLSVSGLPSNAYTFLGFPPRKSGKRLRMLEQEALSPHTLVFYESPYRLAAFLSDALCVLGDRRVAVAIELTKKFEKVHQGWLSDISRMFSGETVQGEVTVVIAGNNTKFIRLESEG